MVDRATLLDLGALRIDMSRVEDHTLTLAEVIRRLVDAWKAQNGSSQAKGSPARG